MYWDVNNLYGWVMSKKPPVNDTEWVKDISQFNEEFIKNYGEESDAGYFLKLMLNIMKTYMNFIMIYHFYLKKWKLKKLKSLSVCYYRCHTRVLEWIHTLLFAWMSRNSLLEAGAISEV